MDEFRSGCRLSRLLFVQPLVYLQLWILLHQGFALRFPRLKVNDHRTIWSFFDSVNTTRNGEAVCFNSDGPLNNSFRMFSQVVRKSFDLEEDYFPFELPLVAVRQIGRIVIPHRFDTLHHGLKVSVGMFFSKLVHKGSSGQGKHIFDILQPSRFHEPLQSALQDVFNA